MRGALQVKAGVRRAVGMRPKPQTGWRRYVSALVAFPILLALSPLLIVVLVGVTLRKWVRGARLKWRFRRVFGAQGKKAVLVYSDSPNWKDYIEAHMLPSISDRVVTLNWSLRSEWKKRKSLEVEMFEHWGGAREYNPMAIVVPRRGRVRVVRFWQAFRDAKHGREASLRKAQEELFHELEAA